MSRKMRSIFGQLYSRLQAAHQRGDHKEVERIKRHIEEERQSGREDPEKYYRPRRGR